MGNTAALVSPDSASVNVSDRVRVAAAMTHADISLRFLFQRMP